ncbi:MAG: 3-phosphoshikimate 1-carboxyvinyltransferase [bacterium]
MNVTVHPGPVAGSIAIPGSKSHTIRALLIASLAEGESRIASALDSEDTSACMDVLRHLGVEIAAAPQAAPGALDLTVRGRSGRYAAPSATLDCRNSGTTLYLAMSIAALHDFPVRFDGDDQLRKRSAGPLLSALESAGARVTREGTGDCVPFTIQGPIAGGEVTIPCPTSQYLSSLLLAAPLTPNGLTIHVPLLNERPYVQITLSWLESQGIAYERRDWDRFTIPGGQRYRAFARPVPADFSSATFFVVAAAVTGSELTLTGLDMTDSQGDKEVVRIAERLGCTVRSGAKGLTIRGPGKADERLAGGDVDLNSIPDALPALAILGTRCGRPLRLLNVPQAREKETDRIAVMAGAINALGGSAEELADGLVVHPGTLHGGAVDSVGDHRIAMAFAVAGLCAAGPITVTNAGVAGITFPGFYEKLASVGAQLTTEADAEPAPTPAKE